MRWVRSSLRSRCPSPLRLRVSKGSALSDGFGRILVPEEIKADNETRQSMSDIDCLVGVVAELNELG